MESGLRRGRAPSWPHLSILRAPAGRPARLRQDFPRRDARFPPVQVGCYANKERIRVGLGYRHSSAWRYEGFLVINRARKSANDRFATADYVAEMTLKRVW
jgi:hypothetical protein